MPFKSPEARSSALFRAASIPLAPPADLDPTSCRLWREVVASRSADWWNAASLTLLRRVCRTAGHVERLHDALDAATIGTAQARDLNRQMLAGNQFLGVLAAKLRLSQQASVDRRSAWITERGPAGADDVLLGGRAIVHDDRGRAADDEIAVRWGNGPAPV